jgi:hypothetical protein
LNPFKGGNGPPILAARIFPPPGQQERLFPSPFEFFHTFGEGRVGVMIVKGFYCPPPHPSPLPPGERGNLSNYENMSQVEKPIGLFEFSARNFNRLTIFYPSGLKKTHYSILGKGIHTGRKSNIFIT